MAQLKRSGGWDKVYQTALAAAIDSIKTELVPEIKLALQRYYAKTFAHWHGLGITATGRPAFPVPFMYFDYKIIAENKGITLKVRTYATIGGNAPHVLWYAIDQGDEDKDRYQPTTSPPIPEYLTTRTQPDSLEVANDRSYTGKFFRISEGTIRKARPPRNWSKLIGKFSLQELQRDLAEYGFVVRAVIVNGQRFKKLD